MLRLSRRLGIVLVLFAPAVPLAYLSACGSSQSTTNEDAGGDSPSSSDARRGDAGRDGPPSDASSSDGGSPEAMCSDYNPDKNVYWGDLHTHTVLSADAYGWGNRNYPHDAYLFATGKTTPIAAGASPPGPTASIGRPLDFDAITDHSEWLAATWGCGVLPDGGLVNPASPYADAATCQTYRADEGQGVSVLIPAAEQVLKAECDGGYEHNPACLGFFESAWQLEVKAAHDAYQPCTFTSLVAYEWTHAVSGATLHQNVIFSSESVPPAPFDSLEYTTPAELWTALEGACVEDAGCTVLTIPHNGNLSEGMAYEVPTGIDAIQQMNRYQRLTEVHQHKGDSECYAGKIPHDPTCDFEHVPASAGGSELPQNFVRHALSSGVTSYGNQKASGEPSPTDPMQMGIVGATDDHNGLPGYVPTPTWQGHLGSTDDTPEKRLKDTPYFNPGAITGVWAEQNTRESIFAALQRRETFATSGPRIVARFYQVWSQKDFCSADGGGGSFPSNVIAAGGVPMGSTMPAPTKGMTSPHFIVSALKDATDLAEVDIIAGYFSAADGGETTEKVYRFTPSSPGTNWSSGSVCLGWEDPSFSASDPSFYYVRVLEAPTWRWSHYDCAEADASIAGCAADGGLDVEVQQRAWTSPIWWLP
jgi:hypothetical protein